MYKSAKRIGNSARILLLALLSMSLSVHAERVKDLVSIAGVRSNQLLGYGLVVGLNGTGDQASQTPYTTQSLKNMLLQYGITIPENVRLQPKNIAAVSVHATLTPFAKPGQTIDVTVSSLGNAKSLRGGTLMMTALRGADGQVYAVAQGDLSVGGLSAEGQTGSSVTINVPSVGRIPNGATVERVVPTPFNQDNTLVLNLHTPDFTTAKRLEEIINQELGTGTATAIDAVSINVRSPTNPNQRVSFLSYLENLVIDPGEAAAKVIVNSRTGTVVIGSHVRVMPAAISHGGITVTISETPVVAQPAPFSNGTTAVVPQSNVSIKQENNRMFLFDPGVTLDEIVRAVNKVGAAPGDLVAILEALKQAGALRAELIII